MSGSVTRTVYVAGGLVEYHPTLPYEGGVRAIWKYAVDCHKQWLQAVQENAALLRRLEELEARR